MIGLVIFSVCVNAEETTAPVTVVNQQDPYESFNRVMYKFNDFLDRAIVKPVTRVYITVLPKPITKSVSNFFSNLNNIPTIINDVLQGNFYQETSDTWRLGINTTIGILGLFDVASHMGLESNSEDFGLTLAHWGYNNSNYLVLPFFGPSTIRDGLGIPVTYYMSVYPYIDNDKISYGLYGVGVVDKRSQLLDYDNVMQQAAIDRYAFMRNAYMQRRNYLIQRNKELNNPYLEKNVPAEKFSEQNLSLT